MMWKEQCELGLSGGFQRVLGTWRGQQILTYLPIPLAHPGVANFPIGPLAWFSASLHVFISNWILMVCQLLKALGQFKNKWKLLEFKRNGIFFPMGFHNHLGVLLTLMTPNWFKSMVYWSRSRLQRPFSATEEEKTYNPKDINMTDGEALSPRG